MRYIGIVVYIYLFGFTRVAKNEAMLMYIVCRGVAKTWPGITRCFKRNQYNNYSVTTYME